MIKKLALGLLVVVAGLFVWAAVKPPQFRVSRSLAVAAPPAAVFPWIENQRKFNQWNPWLKMDPGCTVSYSGPEVGPGAVSSWEGGKTGKGSSTITEVRPNELVRLRMDWLEPLEGTSTVDFTLAPQGEKTVVTWAMYGENGFAGRLMSIFMDCETMCGPQFEKGLADLAAVASPKQP